MLAPRRGLLLWVALLVACGGGDPNGPSTGSLAVAVTGLPGGTAAAVTVTGPAAYTHTLGSSQTLSGLAPGHYTVLADAVTDQGQTYQPSPSSLAVTVEGGAAPASAEVSYAVAGGSLTVSVGGLPPDASASLTVTGPGGYSRPVTATATLSNLAAGVYTVTAEAVSPAGVTYYPSPATQSANLADGAHESAAVSYTQSSSAGLNLRIDGMYLTQSVQTYAGAVPLVKNRDGFLRVFVTASEANLAAPEVRVRFYLGGQLVQESTIAPPGLSVPLSPREGSLTASWNLLVPKALIQPGLSILAEVDPGNAVAESNETDNAFPSTGTPLAMDVRTTSTFSVRFVPVIQSVNGRIGNVTNANKDSYLAEAMRLHPLASYDADLRAPFTTSAPAVDADNTNDAWIRILSQLDALRTADGNSRFYYGVVNPTYSSGVAGVGYIGGRTAVGWDKNGADEVAAHEWGHNWGRLHAPCGGAGNPDQDFPYAGGSIGVYGFDVAAQALKPPTSTDLMGYCNNEWISDYTYIRVLDYRARQAGMAASFAQAMQPCLLVWGRIVDGRPVLEPAFEVVTRPSLPVRRGPYRLEGSAADGSRLFDLSFTAERVADDPRGNEHFAFAVPLPPDRSARLESMRLTVPGGPAFSVHAAPRPSIPTRQAASDIRTTRVAPGRVAVQWDTTASPMVMVRDPSTGQILSFAEGGRAEVATDRNDLEIRLSNGVSSRSVRLTVPAR